MSSLKKKVVSGTFWSVGLQLSSTLLMLITNIFLARLLSPREFGKAGIVLFFITVANVFTTGGLGGAIVRKTEPSDDDYSTIFVFNLVVSIVCTVLMIICSGFIAEFYNDSSIQLLLVVSSSIIIISSFQIVQNTKLVVALRFREKAIYTLVSSVVGSSAGIISAYFGAGVWAIVLVPIVNSFALSTLFWFFEEKFFNLKFSRTSFKTLYSFGINTTLTTILTTAFDNIYQLVLGKSFSLTEVGYYLQGQKLQGVPSNVINTVSQGVIFSALSKVQNNRNVFIKHYKSLIHLFTVLMGLMTVLIFLFSKDLILLLLGKKWIDSVFYMQLLSVASFYYLQEMVNKVIFKVYNETRRLLFLEILKKGIQSVSVIIGIVYNSVEILILGFVITSFISYCINYYVSRRILGYAGYFEFFLIFKISVISALIVIFTQYIFDLVDVLDFWDLLFIPMIVLLYFLILRIFNIFNPITIYKNFRS